MMRIKKINNRAFSLLEILLASIIFIISITGVFITLTAVRKPVADKESALAASVFGKQVLEALRSSVSAGTFYNSCSSMNANGYCPDFSLSLGKHQVPSGNLLSAGLTWPASLTVANTNVNSITHCDTAVACLVYTVSCADNNPPAGSTSSCVNADVARQVTLNINWPEAP